MSSLTRSSNKIYQRVSELTNKSYCAEISKIQFDILEILKKHHPEAPHIIAIDNHPQMSKELRLFYANDVDIEPVCYVLVDQEFVMYKSYVDLVFKIHEWAETTAGSVYQNLKDSYINPNDKNTTDIFMKAVGEYLALTADLEMYIKKNEF